MDGLRESRLVEERLEADQPPGDPFFAAFRATRMAMFVFQPDKPGLPIVYVNEAFERLTGLGRDEAVGLGLTDFLGREHTGEIERAVDEGRPISCEIETRRRDGTRFWNALNVGPVEDEAGETVWYFGSIVDNTARKAHEVDLTAAKAALEAAVERHARDLDQALAAKTALLHEVDHRVKNNLQLLTALVHLQLRRSGEPEVQTALRDVLGRMTAISTVHRRLFQNEEIERFDLAEFLRDLVDDLGDGAAARSLRIELDLKPIQLPSSQAAAVALILNELIANALRHAFPDGRPGRLEVSASTEGEIHRVVVRDDGVGVDWSRAPKATTGRFILELLVRQLDATLEWRDADPGACAVLSLPKREARDW